MRAAVAVVLLALAAGCGGSDEDFVEDAVQICRESNQRVRDLGTPESFTDTLLYARQAEDAVGDQIEDLRGLDPPEKDEVHFEAYLETLEERRRQLDLLSDAADRSNMVDIQSIGSQLEALSRQGRQQAQAAGLTGCE